ncbi:MAG: hypothetical protein ACE5WD_11450 [Candidatus Aminicenantia bacterium]
MNVEEEVKSILELFMEKLHALIVMAQADAEIAKELDTFGFKKKI